MELRYGHEEKLKREPSELEVFVETHARKKGGYVEDTMTACFVDVAKSTVKEQLVDASFESEVVIENQVFDELMFHGEIPKRPVNYGYGVKQSDVYGVHRVFRQEAKTTTSARVSGEHVEIEMLRKQIEESNAEQKKTKEKLTKQIEESNAKQKETNELIKMLVTQMIAMHNGSTPSYLFEGAESVLRVLSSQQNPSEPYVDISLDYGKKE